MSTTVQCPSCGSPVPLLGSGAVRCLFCLERVPLPDDVSEVLDADQDLAAKIERHLDKAERYRKGLRGQASYMLGVIGVIVVVSLLSYWPVLAITWQAAGMKKVIILLSLSGPTN